MTTISPEYQARVEQVAFNVCAVVLPMDQLPEGLVEAYQNLLAELLEDNSAAFANAWQQLPTSAQALLPQADFHGFYIAQAWLQLSRVAQDIADMADSEDAINEQEYDGIFSRLAVASLKESVRKLKKARTDRSMLNSMKQVIG
ncbi:DUF3069 domain-containing protein [Shewanella marina]|uniref:DUF3069 domain-containing protein n=1 Tax=Shewanella marina TaxID=487319 RepID=UPI00046EBD7F|nr:DUF3069 domain-containing protein [Shewanella marina]